jgi:hypothetical protein
MSKSNMSGMPGVDAMTDTLEFVKKMWGGMGIPGMVMPTLSVNEINKQITDLKAVESWLTLNMNMLRGTIQALEVQSATISTLHSMSETMSAMVPQAPSAKARTDHGSVFASPPTTAEKQPPQAEPKPGSAPQPAIDSAADPAAMAAPFANPAAWWNMLQDQFKQAVNTAIVPETVSPAAKPKRAPSAAKPKSAAGPAANAKAAPRERKAAPKV